MKGRLADRQLEALLRDLLLRGSVGVLTLERGPVKKQICLAKGSLRLAASNLRDDRFGEFLVTKGLATLEMMVQAEQDIVAGQRMGEIIARWGTIDSETLRSLKRAHVIEVVLPCFDWKDGQYRFQEGIPNIVGEIMSDVRLTELGLERARRSLTSIRIEKILSDRRQSLMAAVPIEEEAKRITFTPAESFLLAHAGDGAPLRAILAMSPSDTADLERAAAALVTSGILALARPGAQAAGDVYDTLPPGMKAPATRASEPQSDAVSAAELEYFKHMHTLLLGADHYTILDVPSDASTDDIQRAYYRRAKEIHPDRFLAPPLDVLHRDMEELFSQVLEAYNMLLDPAERKRYDTERLSGAPASSKQAATDQLAVGRGNYLRGRQLFEEGKLAEALTFLQNAVEADPTRPEYFRLLASVQSRNPRMRRDAIASYKKAIEMDPARAEAYLQLGLLYRRLGDTEPAIETLRECLKWDPSNMEAGTALAEMTSSTGSRR